MLLNQQEEGKAPARPIPGGGSEKQGQGTRTAAASSGQGTERGAGGLYGMQTHETHVRGTSAVSQLITHGPPSHRENHFLHTAGTKEGNVQCPPNTAPLLSLWLVRRLTHKWLDGKISILRLRTWTVFLIYGSPTPNPLTSFYVH